MAERINRFMTRTTKPVETEHQKSIIDEFTWFSDLFVAFNPIIIDIFKIYPFNHLYESAKFYMASMGKSDRRLLANHIWTKYVDNTDFPGLKDIIHETYEHYKAPIVLQSDIDNQNTLSLEKALVESATDFNKIQQSIEDDDNMPIMELSGDDNDSEDPPPLVDDYDSDNEVNYVQKNTKTTPDTIAQGKYSDLIKQAIDKGDSKLVNVLLNFASEVDSPNEEVKLLKNHIKQLSETNEWLEMKFAAVNHTLKTIMNIVQ